MCGLLFSNIPELDPDQFRQALADMTHRGPDVSGRSWAGAGVQMGHNRLSILDLDARSNQPFRSQDGRYRIIYNGEVYNYRELANQHGIETRTACDTEVVLELYIRYGVDALAELNGMFAFVIYDELTGRTFAARDRLGIKPLYMARTSSGLILASEIGAITALVDAPFDLVSLRQYRKLRTFFNGRTPYRNIEMFPAGHALVDGELQRYWALPEQPQAGPEDEELHELLSSAVAYRCISDVSVGSYLSGGVDSTIVAGLAEKPDTWTVGFEGLNEFAWGRMAAEQFGSRHTEVLVEAQEFPDTAREMILARREPLSVPNEVLLLQMTTRVKPTNTVVLSGEGADELFFGYDRIFRWAAANPWDLEQFTARYCYGSHADPEVVEDALAPVMHRETALDRVAHFFQIGHLHGLLRRLDNSTMRCSVEARVPFVDHRLVERLAGVPFAYRMAEGVAKAPLKRVFREVLPGPIITREKVGFPVPLADMAFGENTQGDTPMDRWLEFNLGVLTGGAWNLADAMG